MRLHSPYLNPKPIMYVLKCYTLEFHSCDAYLLQTAIFRRIKHGKIPDKKKFIEYASPKFSVS